MKVLQARCEKAEGEAQELRAKLAVAGDAKSQALWKAAEAAVGDSEAWQEVRVQHEEWIAEAQSNLDQRHCAQIWRLLRENYAKEVLSNIAQVVGGGAVCVGRLLFDTTSNQTASVQKSMGASQAIMQSVLERRQSNGQESSTSHAVGSSLAKPSFRTPTKTSTRALSRPGLPPKVRMPTAGRPSEDQEQQRIPNAQSAVHPEATSRLRIPNSPPAEVTVRPRIPHSPLGAPAATQVRQGAYSLPQGLSGSPTDIPARQRISQSPPVIAAEAPCRQILGQSPSVRDRIRRIETSVQ